MAREDSHDAVRSLPDLVARIRSEPRFQEVLKALSRGESGTIDGAWGSACALATAALVDAGPPVNGAAEGKRGRGEKGSASVGRHNSPLPLFASAPLPPSATPSTLLAVLPRISDVDDFAVDVMSFAGETPLIFPAWESLPTEQSVSDQVFGARLRVINRLDDAGNAPRIIVTSLPALLHLVPGRANRESSTRILRTGEDVDLEELLNWLVSRGFERESAIERPGEFAVHGGILDVYPPDADDPLRIEFFGDEVDSIRSFDVETQRKVEDLNEVRLTILAPVGESQESRDKSQEAGGDAGEHFLNLLPPGSRVALIEPTELVEEGRNYLARLDNPRGLYTVESTLARCTERPSVTISSLTADSVETTCHLQVESIERFTGPKAEVLNELATIVGRDETVVIACHNEGERERLAELLGQSPADDGQRPTGEATERQRDGETEGEKHIAPSLHPSVPPSSSSTEQTPLASLAPRVRLTLGNVARGFRLVSQKALVLSDHELFSRTEVRRVQQRKKRVETRAIDSFLDLNPGDLVVHLTHGIARYRGMELLDKEGGKEEHLSLEFRDNVRIYVPVSLIHLVQKYVGAAKSSPTLSKVGGSQWGKQKAKVSEAVADMASDMLRLQAERESKPGVACPPDSHWQQEFEASFPYVETPDQDAAIEASKRDLEKTRPMDRLICGDVGFGKTEVAMRAAFKAVDAGRQVAILVPTTVLCEQHYRTFTERMAEFPVTIESLSRFRTKGQQKDILDRAADGKVDIVIGTHRLVQPDVRFKDLGLLIIDEEQRFGVEAKEMLKRLRLTVDVMTLSATPIPRTLHMSLLGIRDISNLTTPPQDRVSIETRICRWDGDLIRHAVVRELNRGGQVYFVHNRVYNIEEIRDRLQRIVPEARIIIGHGQMSDHELERAMVDFVRGKADILVATTIIESGLDIPSANTMFINQAQNYGLAEMHQLRGRVGRYKHRAYCYLLLDEKKPVSSVAAKRLKAIEEYSELGAGFKIAMRDLEIRGAGNILGTEQSGHITTVGYELYCQLLENSVRRLQGLPKREHPHVTVDLPVEAFLPNSYVPQGRPKIDVYRKISATTTLEELAEVVAEMRDRFGPIPESAQRLLDVRELQLLVWRWGIDNVRLESNPFSAGDGSSAPPVVENGIIGGAHRPVYAVFGYRDDQKVHNLAAALARVDGISSTKRSEFPLRIVDRRNAYLLLPRREMTGPELLAVLCERLRAVAPGAQLIPAPSNAMERLQPEADAKLARPKAQPAPAESPLPPDAVPIPKTGRRKRKAPAEPAVPVAPEAAGQISANPTLRGLIRSRKRPS